MSSYPRQIYALYPLNEKGDISGVYVGSSHSLIERFRGHLSKAEKDEQPELHSDMRNYGFRFQVLGTIENMDESFLEYVWIEFFLEQKVKVYNTVIGKTRNWRFFLDNTSCPVWTGDGVVWQFKTLREKPDQRKKLISRRKFILGLYVNYTKLCEERGFSDYIVGKATEIESEVFSEWKTGKKAPTAEQLVSITDLFECSIDDIWPKGDA